MLKDKKSANNELNNSPVGTILTFSRFLFGIIELVNFIKAI
jgi:hypothetical protein